MAQVAVSPKLRMFEVELREGFHPSAAGLRIRWLALIVI
jgi:hypothetical protein